MRRPGGYAIITSPITMQVDFDHLRCETVGEGTHEVDTFTCVHCGRVVHVKPGAIPDELGSMCRNCMQMVCPTCAPGPCIPWLKKLEAAERRDRMLRSYGV